MSPPAAAAETESVDLSSALWLNAQTRPQAAFIEKRPSSQAERGAGPAGAIPVPAESIAELRRKVRNLRAREKCFKALFGQAAVGMAQSMGAERPD